MRVVMALALILTTMSGCTGGGGLSQYLLRPSDLPDACELADPDDGDWDFLREDLNWTNNPGRLDAKVFEEGGIEPVDNLLVIYECPSDEVISYALAFASPEEAQQVADEITDGCEDPEDGLLIDGRIIIAMDYDEDEPDVIRSVERGWERIQASTGAHPPCDEPTVA